ncbi:putative histone-lysine N-methyltransferase PRDM6, partial [Seriola lalandi dorsalis]|uniref:putative histone-lysine N-methyltransferase PRDM6 n=1 Tax=Seriola lalandi dorsalis TaxID=1841481 RepID=UPI000C6F5A3E
MLKPGDPSGSAFLKVDPSYLQHWQQLFPQAQLKAPLAPPPPPPDRLSIPVDSLRQSRLHSHLLASAHCTSSSSSSSSTSSSAASSSAAAAAAAGGPGGPGDLVVVVPPENQQGHNPAVGLLHQAKEQSCGGVGVVSSSVKSSSSGGGGEEGGKGATTRFKLTSEELDYYLYGQQRMEIIPLSNHTGEINNLIVVVTSQEVRRRGVEEARRRGGEGQEVCLCTSTVPGLGYGICAAQRIPQGTWIGPFQGVPLLLDKLQSGAVRNTRHLWE